MLISQEPEITPRSPRSLNRAHRTVTSRTVTSFLREGRALVLAGVPCPGRRLPARTAMGRHKGSKPKAGSTKPGRKLSAAATAASQKRKDEDDQQANLLASMLGAKRARVGRSSFTSTETTDDNGNGSELRAAGIPREQQRQRLLLEAEPKHRIQDHPRQQQQQEQQQQAVGQAAGKISPTRSSSTHSGGAASTGTPTPSAAAAPPPPPPLAAAA